MLKYDDIPCLAVCFGHQLVAYDSEVKLLVNLYGEEGFQDIPTRYGDDDS